MVNIFFFFFQAEDGIRDTSVTGVQTCALPIYLPVADLGAPVFTVPGAPRSATGRSSQFRPLGSLTFGTAGPRSEERRVGKECTARRGPPQSNKNDDGQTVTRRSIPCRRFQNQL